MDLILIFTEYFCLGSSEIVFAGWYIGVGFMFTCDAVTLFWVAGCGPTFLGRCVL